jgi:hypothetical protein
MAAIAPLHEFAPDHGLAVRQRDLKRSPLQRRPMVRAGSHPSRRPNAHTTSIPRPQLAVVPRRRRAMSLVVLGGLLIFGMLIGTVAFQTQIARNQLALDKVEKDVVVARSRYDVLRRQRAELRSQNRLAVEADRLGMSAAGASDFMTVTPDVAAAVKAAASALPADVGDTALTSLDQFGTVKAVTAPVP